MLWGSQQGCQNNLEQQGTANRPSKLKDLVEDKLPLGKGE